MSRDNTRGPIDAEVNDGANRIAAIIDSNLPDDWGFGLLIFKFSDGTSEGGTGRINYISNADQSDMICAMKELLARLEGEFSDTAGHA